MIKFPTLFWLIIVTTAGFAMFAVKYEVQALADQLARTAKQADDTERSLRALEAEWAYLNRPDALAQMNQQLLSLIPIATKQLRADVTDIPMRPVPPPPPAETVAANNPAASAQEIPASPTPQSAVAQNPPAQSPMAQSPAPQGQPTETSRPVVTAALDAPAAARSSKLATAAKPAVVRKAPPHRAASLNELIAQIVESR
jgi:cell division protein FtsL